MAAEDGEQTVEASAPAPAEDARGESPMEKESRKRRAPSADGSTAKRQRQTRDEPAGGPEAQDARPRTDAGPRSSAATQEEKRRGKRLFGGLLNTLSQEAGNSQQQRRRHEIGQRQLAKMQRQAADDDKRRAEKRATLHDVRVRQQITWEESVMRSKHAKRLRLAQFLRTSSSPEIYFLPWKLGRREKDTIDAQVRECKASITRELEDFKGRKE